MNEFSLIDYYFKSLETADSNLIFGIGDDAACLQIPPNTHLLVSTDTLVAGVHFLPEWEPYNMAYKAVMVNISDMAAMGADPRWATLALTLPNFSQPWLNSFSRGLKEALQQYQVNLIGGDTTHGPLAITITIMGLAPIGKAVRRKGARPGDIIVVSGELGAAALALTANFPLADDDQIVLQNKLMQPKPRTELTAILRQYATAAIDISDGLSADLNHICVASQVGACLVEDQIPVHPLVHRYLADKGLDLALGGGDDYELCFTVPADKMAQVMHDFEKINQQCYPIGCIESELGLRLKTIKEGYKPLKIQGYTHF